MRLWRNSGSSELDRQLSPWTRRRILSWTLFTLAIVVALQHLVAHAGWRPIPMGMGKQDLFLGYPMAILLALIAAMTVDPRPRV